MDKKMRLGGGGDSFRIPPLEVDLATASTDIVIVADSGLGVVKRERFHAHVDAVRAIRGVDARRAPRHGAPALHDA
ncbi:hypothetical protein FJV41_18635 [Myxococcus llanfairpwllgwyngyllgogerychwyrndrobwllllantysiliogogogochensis]|uniref:Uncharacterized protein n=1 Tax=Myxococcus llanfairpwllgwyngyllgogerychwyrndrobwllllantysiliogogogochensis TaxID=2590453 RepID=A0A540WZV4_9BACT|nr:hypothetical protein [Myxococcus llanfairpwllgwyngyllgogerychwyrndrobwllllantysiliogogogochensis]TQF14463.1 hypothetical protein FJV41_18635 [Myxococcus llanfairpwllgwyngyllgogerychwyrndrobwllllantysiliogogogochensis]